MAIANNIIIKQFMKTSFNKFEYALKTFPHIWHETRHTAIQHVAKTENFWKFIRRDAWKGFFNTKTMLLLGKRK